MVLRGDVDAERRGFARQTVRASYGLGLWRTADEKATLSLNQYRQFVDAVKIAIEDQICRTWPDDSKPSTCILTSKED